MCTMASKIIDVSIVYSTVCSGADQRKHQSSASLAFVKGIPWWPVNSPHKGPVTRKMFPLYDVIMKFCHVTQLDQARRQYNTKIRVDHFSLKQSWLMCRDNVIQSVAAVSVLLFRSSWCQVISFSLFIPGARCLRGVLRGRGRLHARGPGPPRSRRPG